MLSLLKSLKCIYMMGEECWGRETKYKNDIWYLIPIIKIVLICPFIVTCSYTLLQSTELVFSSQFFYSQFIGEILCTRQSEDIPSIRLPNIAPTSHVIEHD